MRIVESKKIKACKSRKLGVKPFALTKMSLLIKARPLKSPAGSAPVVRVMTTGRRHRFRPVFNINFNKTIVCLSIISGYWVC
jgi:hypothetical protein